MVLSWRWIPLVVVAVACGQPTTVAVDLQVDLEVSAASDPYATLGSVRACVDGMEGGGLRNDFPADPGTHVLAGLQFDRPMDVTVQALDLTPSEIDAGGAPNVLAEARIEGAILSREGSAWIPVPFQGCEGRCGAPCDAAGGVPGDAVLGLRRVERAGEGGEP
ncbi:hypothetical protein L6R50_10305 [Myxococcota bacterium]|nr:hypothetical protein [Myxococcota bacterium]